MNLKVKFLSIINKDFLGISISILKRGYGKEVDRYKYQKEYINFNIKEGDKVVDVGSGGYPFPLATHLVDMYPDGTSHRTEKLVLDGKKFTIANVEKLPFNDKEFDFSYCSHLLEHVNDPMKACEELMRISKRGYIETPTKTSDIMFNFLKLKDHHKWYTVIEGNTIFFFEYKEEERRDVGMSVFFENFHSEFANPFQKLMRSNRHLFNNMFLWSGHFNYCIVDKNGIIINSNL